MRLLSALVLSVFVSMVAVIGPAYSGTLTVDISGNATGDYDGTHTFILAPFDFHLVGPESNAGVVHLTTAIVSIPGESFSESFSDPMQVGLHFVNYPNSDPGDYAFFGYQSPPPDGTDLLHLTFPDLTLLSNTNSFSGLASGWTILAFTNVPTTGPHTVTFTDFSALNLSFVSTTPLPAALPLFATGLGALGLLGWRRKRKAAAVAA